MPWAGLLPPISQLRHLGASRKGAGCMEKKGKEKEKRKKN